MSGLVQVLDWDSDFFGFPIGRVDLDRASPGSLGEVDAEARDLGLACLYGSLDPSDVTRAYEAQRAGHRLVEVAVTLGRSSESFVGDPTRSTARQGSIADLEALADPIARIAPWSRFGADPRFGPEAARRMHEAWVRRAAGDGVERMLAVAEDEHGVTGFSTQVRSPVPRVDLMGVTKTGSGASGALLAALVEWAGSDTIEAGPCAARNIAVLRFLEHYGFRIVDVRYLFHRWLDEDPGAR